MTAPLARVECESLGGTATVRIVGEIDLSNAEAVGSDIDRAVGRSAAVRIDMTGVEYVDSAGIRLLFRLARRLEVDGVPMTVVAPGGSIAERLVRVTRLDEVARLETA